MPVRKNWWEVTQQPSPMLPGGTATPPPRTQPTIPASQSATPYSNPVPPGSSSPLTPVAPPVPQMGWARADQRMGMGQPTNALTNLLRRQRRFF